jgi:hypothetical protein
LKMKIIFKLYHIFIPCQGEIHKTVTVLFYISPILCAKLE